MDVPAPGNVGAAGQGGAHLDPHQQLDVLQQHANQVGAAHLQRQQPGPAPRPLSQHQGQPVNQQQLQQDVGNIVTGKTRIEASQAAVKKAKWKINAIRILAFVSVAVVTLAVVASIAACFVFPPAGLLALGALALIALFVITSGLHTQLYKAYKDTIKEQEGIIKEHGGLATFAKNPAMMQQLANVPIKDADVDDLKIAAQKRIDALKLDEKIADMKLKQRPKLKKAVDEAEKLRTAHMAKRGHANKAQAKRDEKQAKLDAFDLEIEQLEGQKRLLEGEADTALEQLLARQAPAQPPGPQPAPAANIGAPIDGLDLQSLQIEQNDAYEALEIVNYKLTMGSHAHEADALNAQKAQLMARITHIQTVIDNAA